MGEHTVITNFVLFLVFPFSRKEFIRGMLYAARVELFLVIGRFHSREKPYEFSPGGGNDKIVFDVWSLI